MKKSTALVLIFIAGLFACNPAARAGAFDLDSIAKWGKFARFCVNTYRWGDRFFNTYDSTYVVGTGTKFNIKFKTDSWTDFYHFRLEDNMAMNMFSDFTTNVGVHLSYLAVSVGYDMNVSKFFNGSQPARQRLNFAFNCALFSADFFYHKNDVATTLTRFEGPDFVYHRDTRFKGVSADLWGVDIYYFFNHKRYSQAAAFTFGKIQKKSQGTWYLGFSYWNQQYDFNFNALPSEILHELPENWKNNTYQVLTRTYALRAGYGYNWVMGPHWMIGVSESPTLGYRTGWVNNHPKHSMALSNLFRFSAVYNKQKFFFGLVVKVYTNLVTESESTMVGNIIGAEFSVGYRFNLW